MARPGDARRGMAWRGEAGRGFTQFFRARRRKAMPGKPGQGRGYQRSSRQGQGRSGSARHRGVWRGKGFQRSSRLGAARMGWVWLGQAVAGPGEPGQWQGMDAWMACTGVRAPGRHAHNKHNAMTNTGQQRVTRRRAHTWR